MGRVAVGGRLRGPNEGGSEHTHLNEHGHMFLLHPFKSHLIEVGERFKQKIRSNSTDVNSRFCKKCRPRRFADVKSLGNSRSPGTPIAIDDYKRDMG
jgi:hypothetical protein